MLKKIAIFGAGGFGREVAMLIEQINQKQNTWEIMGFYDDGVAIGEELYGYQVLGSIQQLNDQQEELYVVFALGDPKIKKKVISKIQNTNLQYPVLIHPT